MTFPEFIAQRATWLERLRCRLFGHRPAASLAAPSKSLGYCYRCGVRL
jgi:hypothetical protein